MINYFYPKCMDGAIVHKGLVGRESVSFNPKPVLQEKISDHIGHIYWGKMVLPGSWDSAP